MQWRCDRVLLPLQSSLPQLPKKELYENNGSANNNWCTRCKAIVIEDACVGTSEQHLPDLEAILQRHNFDSATERLLYSSSDKLQTTYAKANASYDNEILEHLVNNARDEIINLLALNLHAADDSCLVRDGFIVHFNEDVDGQGCHVGDNYATTSHLFLENNQLCLKSGTLHHKKTICTNEQQNNEDEFENDTGYTEHTHQQFNFFYAKHPQKLPIYTTKWQRSSTLSLQNSVVNIDAISNAEDADLYSLHRLHQHSNNFYCSSSSSSSSSSSIIDDNKSVSYDMSQFIGLSQSSVHKFMIANGGSELVWLTHCRCANEINVDVTCTDDWGEHCSVVGLSSGELVVVDWRCSRNNNSNTPVLWSSIPRPPWEYTSCSRSMASTSKQMNTAGVTSCAAFDSNYRVLVGLKDHHGSLVISDLRRPGKDYIDKLGNAFYTNKKRTQLANGCHTREKWEKMMMSQFVNGAGCLPTGHPISEIVHCPGNIDRIGLVDIRGQAMCLSMNALEYGECYLHESNYNYAWFEQQNEWQESTNRQHRTNILDSNFLNRQISKKERLPLHNVHIKRLRGSESLEVSNNKYHTNDDGVDCSIEYYNNKYKESSSTRDIIDVDALVDSDEDDIKNDNVVDVCNKVQLTNNVDRAFCNDNATLASTASSKESSLWFQKEAVVCKNVHSLQRLECTHPHLIYEMALRSLSPLLNADVQTILRLQNVHMQLESKRNKIARRCAFSSDGKLLIHSTHSLLGVSVTPVQHESFQHSRLSPTRAHDATFAPSESLSHCMETFRVHHRACCDRKGDAVVSVSVAGNNVLAVTTMLGQTWNVILPEDGSIQ